MTQATETVRTLSAHIQVTLGSLFVLLDAVHRFNTPPTNRSSTTAARYYVATLLYGGIVVGTYLSIVFIPLLPEAIQTGGHVPDWTKHLLPEPLLIALFLTTLLPTLPVLEPLDDRVRKSLQRFAAIPHEARRLAAEMRRASFKVPAATQQHVCDEFARHGFDSADVAFDDGDMLHGSWVKLTSLMLSLRDWETDRRFAGFVTRFGEEYEKLALHYEQLVPKVRRWFSTIRGLTFSEGERLGEVASQYQLDLVEQCSNVSQELYTFLSRGLLKCELTYSGRTSRLQGLGFDLTVHRPRLTLNRIMTLFGSVSLVFIFGLTFLQESVRMLLYGVPAGALEGSRPSMGVVLSRTFMIAVIYVAATWCAIYPKERWTAARRRLGQDRPVFAYFVAGTVAALFSVVISFVFSLGTQLGNWKEAYALFLVRYPWAGMSFVTAFVAAWLADDPPPGALARRRQRLQEGLAQAAASIVTAALVLKWIYDLGRPENLPTSYQPPDPVSAMLRAALIGSFIGYNVPTWYREAPRDPEPLGDLVVPIPAGYSVRGSPS